MSTPYKHKSWPKLRRAILERDGRCMIAGPRCNGAAEDVDHVIPWQEGGAWFDPMNLRAACQTCNRGRSSGRMATMAKINTAPARTPSRDW